MPVLSHVNGSEEGCKIDLTEWVSFCGGFFEHKLLNKIAILSGTSVHPLIWLPSCLCETCASFLDIEEDAKDSAKTSILVSVDNVHLQIEVHSIYGVL